MILTIGMRRVVAPFCAFLAYMLDLYWWGILCYVCHVSRHRLMLSLFAALVRYARNVATRLSHWYGLAGSNQKGEAMINVLRAQL